MSVRQLAAVAFVALLAGAAASAGGAVTGHECDRIPQCIAVPGPWVFVPADGEVTFLLDCPGRRGVVGGLDALATSQDVHATFDGILGSPVAFGRTTGRFAFFRAVTGVHRSGAFQPLIGCIPAPNSTPVTTAARVTPIGPPLDAMQVTFAEHPGTVRKHSLACLHGAHLVDSWNATVFATKRPPKLGLAGLITVTRTTRAGHVTATVRTSRSLPPGTGAAVQLGVRCASE